MDADQTHVTLDFATLLPIVRRALGDESAELLEWEQRAFSSLLGAAALSKVYRLSGTAAVEGETRHWSLILKALTIPIGAAATPGWDREIAAFRSGLLDDLPPGLAAPRSYAIEERPEAIWLWQEDVSGEDSGPWSVARFALAARHLGRFAGRSLVVGLPTAAPWLSRGVLRGRVEVNAAFWDGEVAVVDRELFARLFPDGLIERARRVWNERYRLLDALDRLPQALQHGDADRRNLFGRRGPDGTDETAAIDWAWLGVSAVGADLTNLVAASTLWFQSDPRDLPALAEACLAGFAAGLSDAGWAGDPHLARLGSVAEMALRYGPCGPAAFMAQHPAMGQALAASSGYDRDELIARVAIVQRFAFDQLDVVRDDLAAFMPG